MQFLTVTRTIVPKSSKMRGLPINCTVKIITAIVRQNKIMFMITHKILNNYDVYVVLQQLVPEAILSIQLLIPQLYNYRIIVELSEVTLVDFF